MFHRPEISKTFVTAISDDLFDTHFFSVDVDADDLLQLLEVNANGVG
jgi:hypothetical protein